MSPAGQYAALTLHAAPPHNASSFIHSGFIYLSMRLNLHIRREGEILFCEVSGPYSLADFLRLADRVRADRKALGATRVLVDIREVTGDISSLDRYRLGIYCAEKPDRAERLAIVMRREAINWMVENVATNRGLPTCESADPRYAENWLRRDAKVANGG